MLPSPRLIRAVSVAGVCLALGACVVGTVAGAAVGVGATAVKAGTKVAGTAVGVTADATGAAVHAATGGGKRATPN